jgi:hypothetical protein
MSFHFTPLRSAVIRKMKEKQVLARTWREVNLYKQLVGMSTGTNAMEDSMEVPQKKLK